MQLKFKIDHLSLSHTTSEENLQVFYIFSHAGRTTHVDFLYFHKFVTDQMRSCASHLFPTTVTGMTSL